MKYQATLKQEVVFHGRALFTGGSVAVRLLPATVGTGIVFRRIDLPKAPEIEARIENVRQVARSTKIVAETGSEKAPSVQTIEHFMAAVFAYGINNLIIEISGPEMPIFDGSSRPFVEFIEKAGVLQQEAVQQVYTLEAPCYVSSGHTHLVALPSEEFRVSYTVNYPQSPYLKTQYLSVVITPHSFSQEIASSRTFILYEEIAPLMEKGMFKNATLEHGVVIDGEKVLNPEGVRFSDEMVRHKILDLIGDLALLQSPLHAHLIAVKTGHEAHHAIAKKIRQSLRKL